MLEICKCGWGLRFISTQFEEAKIVSKCASNWVEIELSQPSEMSNNLIYKNFFPLEILYIVDYGSSNWITAPTWSFFILHLLGILRISKASAEPILYILYLWLIGPSLKDITDHLLLAVCQLQYKKIDYDWTTDITNELPANSSNNSTWFLN